MKDRQRFTHTHTHTKIHSSLTLLIPSAQGPVSPEQTGAPEGSGEEKEGANSQGSERGAGGPQEEERPGDRAHEKTTEARAGKGWGQSIYGVFGISMQHFDC